MDHQEYLKLSQEEKNRRKRAWERRKTAEASGPIHKAKVEKERALKALFLLTKDREKECLSNIEREALSAIVLALCQKSFFFFAKYVLGFNLLTEETHLKWCIDLQTAIRMNKTRIMRLKPRKTFKTTLYGISFILWIWGCISPDIRLFYTSSSPLLLQEVADALTRFIGTDKNETLYSSIFGIVKDMRVKNTGDVFNILGRSGKGFSLILRTSGGSTVGVHPNVIIIDDACGEKDRTSQAERDEKERWYDTLQPLLVHWQSENKDFRFETILYIGTFWHFKDLPSYILKKNEILPDELKWDVEIESVVKEDGTSNYPEFITDRAIMAAKLSMSEEFFSCQLLNKPLSGNLILFDLDKLSFLRPDQVDNTIGQMLCVFDPSLGKTHSDYPAVWWTIYDGQNLIFFDAIDKKTELNLLIHQIAARNKYYGCREMIYEDNGTILMDKNLKEAHALINHDIYIHSIHHGSEASKADRIMSMQPDLYSGFVKFMSDYKDRYPEAMNQVVYYPVYGPVDFPDCAQIAVEYFRKPRFNFERYEGIL